MKKLLPVLFLAAVAAVAVYQIHFRLQTADLRDTDPQQWFRREYSLSDAQYAAVQRLEETYRPVCDRHCSDYRTAHTRLQDLITRSPTWTPEIGDAMADTYRIEMECRRDMLRHAYDVSAAMAPNEGRRYMAMILSRISLQTPEEMRQGAR
jgi:hypothetical protein